MDTNSGRRLRPAFVIWFVALTIPTIAYASAEVVATTPSVATAEPRALIYPRYEPLASIRPAATDADQTLRESLILAAHRQYLRAVARQKHLEWVQRQQEQRAAAEEAAREAQDAARQQVLPPSPPSPPDVLRPDWYAIAQCESGGNWSVNTGNGFWGGLQFLPTTWFEFGGGPFSGSGPFPYSVSAQIAVAERVLSSQGPGAWPNCFHWT